MKPFLILAALWFTPLNALQAVDPPPSASKPNVLFIAIDDLRTSLGCYGDQLVKSPNMDRLAQSARLFNRAYTHQAVCGPARAAILTGRLPDNTRVWHNRNLFRKTCPDLVTLPQLFKNNGYVALSLGKVFSGNERELDPISWSAPEILLRPGWKNYALLHEGNGKGASYEAAELPDEGYPDGKLALLAVETLKKLKQQRQPFFLAIGFFKPHLPFNAPKRYWDLYDPAVFELKDGQTRVGGAPEIAYHSHRELGGYRDMPKDERLSAAQTRTLRHGYYACVSYTDAQVGKLLQALHRLGLDKNTIVVLWGDHGYALGEKKRWCKGTNFEQDTRVPLMIRTPWIPQPGAATEALVECVDVYPTLAELASLKPTGPLDGRSLVPILKDPAARGREAVLSQFTRPWKRSGFESMGYSIRTMAYRYTRWIDWTSRKMIAEELYDYTSEASVTHDSALLIEQQNQIEHPAYAETRQQLRAKLDEVLGNVDRTDNAATSGASTPRDFTFIITSDAHYDAFENEDRNDRVRDALRAINAITNLSWPEKLGGGPVATPRGVLLLGDVIDDGDRIYRGKHQTPRQYRLFLADFGFDGKDGLLNFPVFETWGNHDGPPIGQEKHGFSFQAKLKERNLKREQQGWLTGLSHNGLHYSWDWQGVHFVSLGIYPADRQNDKIRYSRVWHDPQGALSFLKKDLAENVGDSRRPVILLSHCGFDTDWWHRDDWRAVYEAASSYRVILYCYGHSGTGLRTWAPDQELAPWQCLNTGQTERGFFIVRITARQLRAAYRMKDWKETREAGQRPVIHWDGDWKWMHILERAL